MSKQHADREFLNKIYPEGITWDANLPRTDLVRLIDWAVKEYKDKYFSNFMGRRMKYEELGEQINAAAATLQDMGVTNGTKIGLHMANSPYYPIMFFAILKAGGTVVNLSPLDSQDEMENKIKDSGASMVVTLDLKSHYDKNKLMLDRGLIKNVIVCPLAEQLPTFKSLLFPIVKFKELSHNYLFKKNVVSYRELTARMREPAEVTHGPDDVAVLQYTGGTTGIPKAAMLTHFNLVANMHQVEHFFAASPGKPLDSRTMTVGGERFLAALPFFHIFGLTTNMLGAIRFGGEMVILPDPRNIQDVLKAIDKEKPTIFPTVPRLLQAMSEKADLSQFDLSSLKAIMTGGAALPPTVRDAFEKAAKRPGLVMQGYGLTESSPVVTSNPPHGDNRSHTAGLPYPRTEVRIGNPDAPDQTLQKGEIGEILVKGPQVMKGYYNRPDETAKMFAGEWLRTGDLGFLDDEGYVHIVDRLKDMVIVNGFNVYPTQVEQVVAKFPGVAECAVIGVNKGEVNESAKVYIRFAEGAEVPHENQVRDYLKKHLSAYENPRFVEFWTDELPKTAIGKPDRKALEKMEKERAAAAKSAAPQP